jgi:hypothetical protein
VRAKQYQLPSLLLAIKPLLAEPMRSWVCLVHGWKQEQPDQAVVHVLLLQVVLNNSSGQTLINVLLMQVLLNSNLANI